MSVPGVLSWQQMLRILWGSGTGKAGLVMIGIMVFVSLYVVATMPLDYGTRIWSNPNYWKDYPKLAPPDWYRAVFDQSLLPQTFMRLDSPTSSQIVGSGGSQVRVLSYEFSYTYNSPTFPQNMRIAIYGIYAANPQIPIVITLSLARPDGRIDQLYYEILRIPPQQAGQKIFTDVPKEINAYGNTYMATQISGFYYSTYRISMPASDILGFQYGVEKAIFAKPVQGVNGSIVLEPLNGAYRFILTIQLTSSRDLVDYVTFAVVGRSYGLMGTDDQGRDLAQALLYGFPVALLIGFVTSLVTSMIGMILGVLSGYYGGFLDEAVQRTADIMGNFPLLPLLILLTFITPSSLRLQILVATLIIFGWAGLAIIVRSIVLSIKAEQYVEAARAMGASSARIIFRHLMPQVIPYVVAQLIFFVPTAILTEAGLSLLGLGDPNIPTWGQILSRVLDKGAVSIAWWWVIPPGLLIVFSAVTFVLLALALEPVVDPRLRRRF